MRKLIKNVLAIALGSFALLGVAALALREATVNVSSLNTKTAVSKVAKGVKTLEVPPVDLGIGRTPAVSLNAVDVEVLVLGPANTLVLRGPVTDESASTLQKKLLTMSHTLPLNETIYLVLDTPGGSISAGNSLIDTARGIPQKVKTLTIFAASMGFHIAQNLDERLIVPRGTLMSHQATFGGVGGEVNSDGTGQLISRLKWSMRMIQLMDATAAARMDMELNAYQQMIKPEYWVDGQDAVNGKAADKVILASCSPELVESTTLSSVETMFGTLAVEFSSCPLITFPISVGRANLHFANPQQEEEFNKFLKTMFEDKEAFVKKFIVNREYEKFLK